MVQHISDHYIRARVLIKARAGNQGLIDSYDAALEQAGTRYGFRPPSLQQIIEAAPFFRYGYIEWMIRQLAKRHLTLTNLEQVKRYLAAFDVLKERPFFRTAGLSKDIGSYDDLPVMMDKLGPLMPRVHEMGRRKSIKWLNSIEKEYYEHGEAILLVNRPGYKIVAPLSVAAARYFETGTNWCTGASDAPNFLYFYLADGLSIDVLFRHSTKRIGIHLPYSHYVDENDHPLELSHILVQHPTLVEDLKPQLMENMISSRGEILREIPLAQRTFDLCSLAVKCDGELLAEVPKSLRSYEMCDWAIENDGIALRDVPDALRPLFYTKAVCRNGAALQFVPEDLRDEDLCGTAVIQDGMALLYVPIKFQGELFSRAVHQNGAALQCVPEDKRTEELCRIAIGQDGRALQFVPHVMWATELYSLAVSKNGVALKYLPENYIDYDLCLAAVENDGMTLNLVPKAFRTRKLCETALCKNGRALQYVPEDILDFEMCKTAVINDWRAVEFVKKEEWLKELWHLAADVSPGAFKDMPKEYGSRGVYERVVRQDGDQLQHVPHEKRSPDLCELAVKNDAYAIYYVPTFLQTDRLLLTALLAWRKKCASDPWANNFPPLPSEKADEWARAIGLRFNKKTGEMNLVPPDREYFRGYGLDVPLSLAQRKVRSKPLALD